ncbi:hypothetical protein ACW0KB_02655 [Virgibacillus salarius]
MAVHLTPQEASEIRNKWIEKGKPKCDHSHIGREYINGTHSDYVCLGCGAMHTNREAFEDMK